MLQFAKRVIESPFPFNYLGVASRAQRLSADFAGRGRFGPHFEPIDKLHLARSFVGGQPRAYMRTQFFNRSNRGVIGDRTGLSFDHGFPMDPRSRPGFAITATSATPDRPCGQLLPHDGNK